VESEEVTRKGLEANNHTIIDPTPSSPNTELNWSVAVKGDATGSDHEIIVWQVPGDGPGER